VLFGLFDVEKTQIAHGRPGRFLISLRHAEVVLGHLQNLGEIEIDQEGIVERA
jgi:hypothetical protein